MLLAGGSTDWTISGNSFYQTATRTAVSQTVTPILINNTSGNNFTVTGNFIGGDSPSAAVTAQKWTTTGFLPYLFQGIRLTVGGTTASSVQGNTIANIIWTVASNASTLPGVWSGIYVTAGNVNIGTVTGNTIGSGTGTGSISVTGTGSSGTSFGIGSASSGTVAIANNSIGSITVNGSAIGVSASLIGISVTAGANTITGNTVGSTTTANSLNAANSSVSTTGQQVTGILSSSTTSASITGNTVANLNNNYAGTAATGQIRGIVTSAGVNTITGNTVRNLSTTSLNTDGSTLQSVYGIAATSTAAGQTVSHNTVHSLANTAASAAVNVTGVYFAGPTSGTNVIARNFVHSLAVSSSSTSSQLVGIYFAAGTFTAQNNMVRVGLKADGTSTAGASIIYGLVDTSTEGRNFYHNTVYVGGTQTSGASASQTVQSFNTGNRTFQNNIFMNARSNSGATSRHNAVIYGGTGVNPTGLTAGGNIYVASGIGGAFGRYNNTNIATLAAWQTATGQDATSAVSDPLLVNPTGTADTVDLHLQPSNPVEGSGIPLTDAVTGLPVTVTDDFDGQARSTLTPADIGADAGKFTLSSDLYAPRISYPLLTSGSTANRVLTSWATITDIVGVSGGANAPRLYFKKSTDADVFGVANDSTGNGWKFVTGTDTGGGSYSFILDYSLINGGSVSNGNTVQYFVVAQDAANNLASNPLAATASTNPPVQNISVKPAAGVNSFNIVGSISGTKTVGTGGDYPSFTGAGGLFAAINASVLTGNVTVNIISDLSEDGSFALNSIAANNYPLPSITIQPDSASMRTISGSVAAGLITLNGADRVTIDGSFGGSGRYLTFRNTSTSIVSSTIRLQNDSSNNAVRNCVVEGATTSGTLGVISFSTGTVTGNDNNLISGCQVRDLSTAAGVPSILIGSQGSSSTVSNSGNTVSNNDLFNFNAVGIYVAGTGNDSWTLSGNNIYEDNAVASSLRGIESSSVGTSIITGNTIRNMVTSGAQSLGIFVFPGSGANTTISGNRITSFTVNAATTDVRGIVAQGSAGSTVNIVNNQITLIPATSGSTSLYGLFDNGTAGTVVNAYHNSIVIGGTETGSRNSWASYRNQTNAHTSRNNLFLNFRTGGTGNHFAAGREGTGGTYIASHNVYAGTAANYMDFSSANGTAVPVSFAIWQTSTGDTSSQAGIAGSGNFTSAMFVSASTGNLHLVPGGNVLVNGTGTPIAGVTTDFDGDLRSLTAPVIGADEILFNNAPSAVVLSPSSVILAENANTSSAIELSTISITDDGAGANTLSLSGTDAASFEVVAGKLRLKSGVSLDFETKPSYSARVNVDDTTVGGSPDAFADFTLTIGDVNEAPIIQSANTASVSENQLSAYDIDGSDVDLGSILTYGISGTDAGLFDVDSTTGLVTFKTVPDFETPTDANQDNVYLLTVSVSDGQLNTSQPIAISLADVNENVTLAGTIGNDVFVATVTSSSIDVQINAGSVTSYPRGTIFTIDGNAGTDQVQILGSTQQTIWTTTAANSSTARILGRSYPQFTLTSIESLRGSDSSPDSFTITSTGSLSGSIHGGVGPGDSLDNGAGSIDLLAKTATGITGGWDEIEKFSSNDGTFQGPGYASTWDINGVNKGSLNYLTSQGPQRVEFFGFSKLVGGGQNDTFNMLAGGSVTEISDLGGSDVISYATRTSDIRVTLNAFLALRGTATDLVRFSNVDQIVGGLGSDTLAGPTAGTATIPWTVNSAGGGYLGTLGSALNFSSFEILSGSNLPDVFTVENGGSVSLISGGAGSSLDKIVGPTPNSSDVLTQWYLQSTGGGTLNTSTRFMGIESITGGGGSDQFDIDRAGKLTGTLDGGLGDDILDYTRHSAGVTVDLSVGAPTATNITRLVDSFEVILGGNGNDSIKGSATRSMVIVGGSGNDTITGGTGRDILIGGLGSDTIRGGSGEDIVIGGAITDSTSISRLRLLQNEWTSGRTYQQRIDNLMGVTNTGVNGTSYLSNGSPAGDMLLDDSAVDTLYGEGDFDWLIGSLQDVMTDLDPLNERRDVP